MYRHRYRRGPFTDFINWTDYRWDPAPRPHAPIRGPWGRQRRYGLLQILVAGLAVVLGVRVFSAYRSYRGSWLGKAVLGALVLAAVAAISSARRSRPYHW